MKFAWMDGMEGMFGVVVRGIGLGWVVSPFGVEETRLGCMVGLLF